MDLNTFAQDVEYDNSTPPEPQKPKRGRPKGSTKDQKQIAQEQAADRDLISEGFPGIGFNCRAQAVEYMDGETRQILTPGQLKHIEHSLGLRTGKSLPKARAQAAAEFLIACNRIDPVKRYLEGITAAALPETWEAIAHTIFGPIMDLKSTYLSG